MKAVPAWLLVVVAVAGAAGGFLAYRHYAAGEGPPAQLTRPAPPTPAASAPAQAAAPAATSAATGGAPASAIPETVPDVQLPDLAGKPHGLRAVAGKARLFNFWATWCEPCRREIPLLNRLQAEYAPEGVQVVGIAVDFRESVRDFLKTTKFDYPLLVGEEDGLEVAQKFGVELVLPFTVFADGRNRIVAVKIGELHREEAESILATLRDLEAGRITLGGARTAISTRLAELSLQRAKQSKK